MIIKVSLIKNYFLTDDTYALAAELNQSNIDIIYPKLRIIIENQL